MILTFSGFPPEHGDCGVRYGDRGWAARPSVHADGAGEPSRSQRRRPCAARRAPMGHNRGVLPDRPRSGWPMCRIGSTPAPWRLARRSPRRSPCTGSLDAGEVGGGPDLSRRLAQSLQDDAVSKPLERLRLGRPHGRRQRITAGLPVILEASAEVRSRLAALSR
jgi:hypothetical protein